MKQLVMTFAAALFATALMAEVVSGNIVGYNTSPVTNGFSMISVNFDNITNSSVGLDLNVVFPPTTPGLVGALSGASGADEILIWDNAAKGYSFYFLYYTTKTTTASTLNWTWRVSGAVPANVQLKSGDTVWFNKKGASAASFAIAGQVPSLNQKNRTLTGPGFSMIGNLYSADWTANDLGTAFWSTSGASGALSGASGADEILVWDNATKGYSFYFLYYTTKTTTASTLNWTWRVSGAVLAPTNFLKVGAGAWYNRKTAATVTMPIDRPYSMN